MSDASEHDDDVLFAELARVLRAEAAPPPELIAAAKELYTWRTVDSELAELVYDSVLDDEPALVRAAEQPRILSFEAGELVIEVEVDETPGARRVLGQLVPAQAAQLELWAGDTVVHGQADELGRFTLSLPADRSLVHLLVRTSDRAATRSAGVQL